MRPLHVFCGTGDHLWAREREPVDSPATIEALVAWLHGTYGVSRLYWRGGQGDLWDRTMKVGPESVPQHDWFQWMRHLNRTQRITTAAVDATRRRGMEVFLYCGLLEFGVQPDVGIVTPYLIEDELRREHPDWCPLDRWGERRCPGTLSFAYPEARQALVRRYAAEMERFGYDGVAFYTYVENVGSRYPEEFGFEAPVLDEFARTFPEVDPRRDALSPEQKEHWQRCRGHFITLFLRDLRQAFQPTGRRLSVILDAADPDHAQPWWGKELAGTGPIHLDWRRWVADNLVDELWVQLGAPQAQRRTLDLLLAECRGRPTRITVRAVDPFAAAWDPYVAAGVTPIAVITAPRNGIERFTRAATGLQTLHSPDWTLRLQTLADIAAGRLAAPAAAVAAMADDPAVLVRRQALIALAAMGAGSEASVIEARLADPESSVRIAAAGALAKAHGADSVGRLLAALARDGTFQMKEAAVEALVAMDGAALTALADACSNPAVAVREVSARALGQLGRSGHELQALVPLRRLALDPQEADAVRYYAIEGLVAMRETLAGGERQRLATDLVTLSRTAVPPTVRLRAAWGLGHLHGSLDAPGQSAVVDALATGFRSYGDGCVLSDAAFGWRVFGNALLQCHGAGRERLEAMRVQRADRWLAWLAYEAVHVPQRGAAMALCTEAEALRAHAEYAPPFPGWRSW